MARTPTIMIPYPGACKDPAVQDLAVYLRPESNGVKVESTIFKVIHDNPHYRKVLDIVYLANLPGDFLSENRIIEDHYALKVRFARQGKKAFTEIMKTKFSSAFHVPFKESSIIGSFEALGKLHLTEQELFHIWVPADRVTYIHGQHIKNYKEYFIVNYDIPALLHMYSKKTDIFAMILRCFMTYGDIHLLIDKINAALKAEGIITNPVLHSHVFHYSKSPFEQILDGIGYVYKQGDRHIELSELSFLNYLISRGCREEEVIKVIQDPIMHFRNEEGEIEEDNIFVRTFDNSFAEAYRTVTSALNFPLPK